METHKTKNPEATKQVRPPRKWLFVFTTIFFIAAASGLAFLLWFENAYDEKIYPGVSIVSIPVGQMTQDQARLLLDQKIMAVLDEGISFYAHGKKVIVPYETIASDPDLSQTIIDIDADAMIKQAYTVGRQGTLLDNLLAQAKSAFSGTVIPTVYTVNEQQVHDILASGFSELEQPGRDSELVISGDTIRVTEASEGKVFDYDRAVRQLIDRLKQLDATPIELALTVSRPRVQKTEAELLLPQARAILATSTPVLVHAGREWQLKKSDLIRWLEFGVRTTDDTKKTVLQFNREKAMLYLKGLADQIDIEPVDATFKLTDGRVTQFQVSRQGKKLNLESTYSALNINYFDYGARTIGMVVEVTEPSVATSDINDLGIQQLLGTGRSNFAGSPKNRRLNIANGAKLLDGILIRPGEEFSLLKALAPFDDTNGYLPELVIKGNRTIPEFGGGLCQIGTTVFRAAIHSGLPITERRNHSYRVVYYEPAGMDATIYEPSPDFKFINDTPGHILLTTHIDGDDLIFQFYGTSDGRIAEVPERARIFNITEPGEPRFIETDELPPGEKKLVEKPHPGASAEFDYTVTYPNGEIKKTTFTSHYVAWRETWLVGVVPGGTSSTTPDAALPTTAEPATDSFN